MSTTPLPAAAAGPLDRRSLVYVLYLLSIPSFAMFALLGVIVALAARDGASPLARSHLDDQIRIWFVAFWWTIGLAIACADRLAHRGDSDRLRAALDRRAWGASSCISGLR